MVVTDLFGNEFREEMLLNQEKFFGARNRINQDVILLHISDIKADLEMLRKEYSVPILRPQDDWWDEEIQHEDEAVSIDGSNFLSSLSDKDKFSIHKKLSEILYKYRLPMIYDDWLQYLFLYRKLSSNKVKWDWDYTWMALVWPEGLETLNLTSAEKKYIKESIRRRLGLKKGKVPKLHAELYSKINTALRKSRNKIRGKKVLQDTLLIQQKRKGGKSMNTIIIEDFPDDYNDDSKPTDLQRNATYRKRMERLNKLKREN